MCVCMCTKPVTRSQESNKATKSQTRGPDVLACARGLRVEFLLKTDSGYPKDFLPPRKEGGTICKSAWGPTVTVKLGFQSRRKIERKTVSGAVVVVSDSCAGLCY